MIEDLLKGCERIPPIENITKGKVNYIIRFDDNNINATHVVLLQKHFSYIANKYDNGKITEKNNMMVRVQIKAKYFKDNSVVLFIESLFFSLLKNRKIMLYFHISGLDREQMQYNFYKHSALNAISMKQITSSEYCYEYKKTKRELHYFRYFVDSRESVGNDFVSTVETDISLTLKRSIKSKVTINEICTIVGELADNVLTHAKGEGIISIFYELLKKGNDKTVKYYQFTINVLNFSDNYLHSGLQHGFLNKTLKQETMKIIENAYLNQYPSFSDIDYSEDIFFMVSSFQKGTTTRVGKGGTGLNIMIKNLIDKSESIEDNYDSYVYSGKNILFFNGKMLNKSNIGDNIAFNEYNNYMMRPDKKCLASSAFEFKGTAYDLMFVVKEDNL